MTNTVIDLEHFIYAKKSNYIKSFTNRKLYANKSEKKMEFKQELDEDEIEDIQKHSNNIFATVFPQAALRKSKVNIMREPDPNNDIPLE